MNVEDANNNVEHIPGFNQFCRDQNINVVEVGNQYLVANKVQLNILKEFSLRNSQRIRDTIRETKIPWKRKRNSSQHDNAKKRKLLDCKETSNIGLNHPLVKVNIILFNSSKRDMVHKKWKLPRNHILNSTKNGRFIFDKIMNTDVDVGIDRNCDVKPVYKILKYFQRKHQQFNYKLALNRLPETNDSKGHLISPKTILERFQLILAKVVPPSLFGDCFNKKIINQILYNLLCTPADGGLNLKRAIDEIDVSKISWLKNVNNREKKVILSKLIKWFFNSYIIRLLHTYFQILPNLKNINSRIFMCRGEWVKAKSSFEKSFIKKSLIPYINTNDDDKSPLGLLSLAPSQNSIRPIVQFKNIPKTRNNLIRIRMFLNQLYKSCCDATPRHTIDDQLGFILKPNQSNKNKLYFVSCDIRDAYGSIIQAKLASIIKLLSDEKLGQEIKFRNYAMIPINVQANCKIQQKECVSFDCLNPPFTRCVVMTPNDTYIGKNNIVTKSLLLKQINTNIFSQKVKIDGTKYRIRRGVPQGGKLSMAFANIYYGHMVKETFGDFLDSGMLMRYVDDFLYVTDSEETARRFLQVTKKGVVPYNCQFNQSKTQSNLLDGCDTIFYLGYKIDCNNCEITPTYPDIDYQFLTNIISPTKTDPMKVLKYKLLAFERLKLTKVTMNAIINSEATILNSISQASVLQASIAYSLILSLFDDVKTNAMEIFNLIKQSVNKITTRVLTNLLAGDKDGIITKHLQEWKSKIVRIQWYSYKKIFSQNKSTRNNFLPLILERLL